MDDSGSEPDYRFTLANERTYLAWIRTSIALLAGAVAVVQLDADYPGLRRAIGIVLGTAGLAAGAMAYRRWAGRDQAIRRGEPLPRGPALLLLGLAVAIVAALVLVLVVITDP
jgi:putative membrane protein